MQTRNVPASGVGYWAALCGASVFGADCGDSVSHLLGLGHIRGVPFLAAGFALTLLAERRTGATSVAYYWLAIVILRTGATNVADLMTHDLKLGYIAVGTILTVCLGLCVSASGIGRGVRGAVPPVDALYWVTMGIAGTVGTVWGDALSRGLGGAGSSTLALMPVFVAVFAVRGLPGFGATWSAYWVVVAVVRTIGTTFGDWSAGGLGLLDATILSGVAFISTVAVLGRPAVVGVGRTA